MNEAHKSFARCFCGVFSPRPAHADSVLLQNQAAAVLKCCVIYKAYTECSCGAAELLCVFVSPLQSFEMFRGSLGKTCSIRM